MLNPSPARLLQGIADALAAVVSDIPPGSARDQVHAAVGIIRKAARSLPLLYPYLLSDIDDLSRSIAGLLSADTREERIAELLAAAAILPTMLPTLDELVALDLGLRAVVAEAAENPSLAEDSQLRALVQRLSEREATLRLSPWER